MNALTIKARYLIKLGLMTLCLATGLAGPGQAQTLPALKGVNFSGLTFTPGQQAPVPYAIPYYAGKGMNVFRIGVLWELLQPTLNGPLNPTVMAQIIALRDQAAAAHTYVIVEIHNYGRRDGVIIGETPLVTSAHFSDLWTKLSNALGSWPNGQYAILGLMNEPHDQNTGTYVGVVNAAIAAIRKAGHDNLILVNGNNWGTYGWMPGSDNLTQMLGVSDPLWKYAFDLHLYFDPWGAGQSTTVVPYATWSQGLLNFITWARQNGKKGFVGEVAAPAGTAGNQAVTQFLGLMSQSSDVMMGWAWWGGGGWWAQNYMFMLDPYASQWDWNNPDRHVALGGTGKSTTWAGPMQDKPQMQALAPYLTN